MEIKIEISEGDITAVKPGMPITYTILSNPETEYKATLITSSFVKATGDKRFLRE